LAGLVSWRCEGFHGHVAAALDGPFIVLFEHDRAGEANDSVFIGEDADDLGASLDLAVCRRMR
jgi:hypothetical protein